MKTLIYILLFLLPASSSLAQGITLQEMPFEEALRRAGEQGKLLFIDFYTGWCMPCAEMARRLETGKAAADFFSPRFVTVKFDLEHGEGKVLRDRFGITGIPTYLICAPDGTELYRRVGALPLDLFIEKMATGADPANAIRALEEAYDAGTMSNERVMDYLNILIEGGHVERSVEVAARLLAGLTDEEKCSPRYWPAFKDRHVTPAASPNFIFMMDHLERFRENVPAGEIDRKIEENFYPLNGFLVGHEVEGGLPLLDALDGIIHAYDLPGKARLAAAAALSRVLLAGDVAGIVALLERDLPDGTIPLWQCEKALELVATRGDDSSRQRLARLGERLLDVADAPVGKERVRRAFQVFM
ncbi:MAG: thioredoxin family protein [Odoribacteraceae bacterium]|jgi:thiol-disulfide isomerase/thioredoxin|nr:thioredoxin family protein [Odoribacteraceae bacterium]